MCASGGEKGYLGFPPQAMAAMTPSTAGRRVPLTQAAGVTPGNALAILALRTGYTRPTEAQSPRAVNPLVIGAAAGLVAGRVL